MSRPVRDVVISVGLENGKEYLYHVCRGIKCVEMTKAYKESIELMDGNDFVKSISYQYYDLNDAQLFQDLYDHLMINGDLNKALRRYKWGYECISILKN